MTEAGEENREREGAKRAKEGEDHPKLPVRFFTKIETAPELVFQFGEPTAIELFVTATENPNSGEVVAEVLFSEGERVLTRVQTPFPL